MLLEFFIESEKYHNNQYQMILLIWQDAPTKIIISSQLPFGYPLGAMPPGGVP